MKKTPSFLDRHRQGELDENEDRNADLFYLGIDRLVDAGYQHYEISNYARSGFQSRHNRAYWRGADYLGLGPGAVSTFKSKRWKNIPDTAAYIADPIGTKTEKESLTEKDLQIERIALQLRTSEGLATGLLASPNPVEPLIQQGLVEEQEGRIVLTREGKALADPIAGMLV